MKILLLCIFTHVSLKYFACPGVHKPVSEQCVYGIINYQPSFSELSARLSLMGLSLHNDNIPTILKFEIHKHEQCSNT